MEHLGSSCGNVWPLFCKCFQCLKKTIQKGRVIFGRVEEEGKQHSLELGPGGSWNNRQTSTATEVLARDTSQASGHHLQGQAEGQTGHLVLEMNKQANKKLGSSKKNNGFDPQTVSFRSSAPLCWPPQSSQDGDFLVGL